MSWLTKKIAQAVAGKELEQLHRIKTDLQMYRRWLAEFPEISLLLDTIAANHDLPGCYDKVNCQDVMRLREQMRGMAKPSASQTADSEPQASLCRNGEAQECPCNACHNERLAANPSDDPLASLIARARRGMVLCPTCGNKRCPHANDHRHACTGSNLPGQPGSAYPNHDTRYPLDGVESDGGEL